MIDKSEFLWEMSVLMLTLALIRIENFSKCVHQITVPPFDSGCHFVTSSLHTVRLKEPRFPFIPSSLFWPDILPPPPLHFFFYCIENIHRFNLLLHNHPLPSIESSECSFTIFMTEFSEDSFFFFCSVCCICFCVAICVLWKWELPFCYFSIPNGTTTILRRS